MTGDALQRLGSRHVPGVLSLHAPEGAAAPVPVVFDSPHSGTCYPADFGYVLDHRVLRRGEDTYVAELYGAAPAGGAYLLEALFPRTYIDPNRPEDDLDQSLLASAWPDRLAPTIKSRSGIGLIWKIACENAPIYDRLLSVAEVRHRIDAYFRPYHVTLETVIDELRGRFGAVWHVNCHSMPSRSEAGLPARHSRPDFCLGDRDGTSADRDFVQFVYGVLRSRGYRVTINDPYKGVELVRRHGRPADRMSSLQIEVNQSLFLDEESGDMTGGFAALKSDIDRLVAAICGYARDRAPA